MVEFEFDVAVNVAILSLLIPAPGRSARLFHWKAGCLHRRCRGCLMRIWHYSPRCRHCPRERASPCLCGKHGKRNSCHPPRPARAARCPGSAHRLRCAPPTFCGYCRCCLPTRKMKKLRHTILQRPSERRFRCTWAANTKMGTGSPECTDSRSSYRPSF